MNIPLGPDTKISVPMPEVKDPKGIHYNSGNGEYFTILKIDELKQAILQSNALQQAILNQLKEINYYQVKAHGDDSDIERVKEVLKNG